MRFAPLTTLSISARALAFTAAVVAEGTLDDIMAVPESLTGQYMSGKRKIEVPKQRVAADPEKC